MQYVANINGLTDGRYSDFRSYVTDEHFPRHPDPQKRPPVRSQRNSGNISGSSRGIALCHGGSATGTSPLRDAHRAGVEAAILAITTSQSGFAVPDTLDHWVHSPERSCDWRAICTQYS